jgi:hypothetical protein
MKRMLIFALLGAVIVAAALGGLALASSGSSGGVPPVTVRTANVTVPGGTARYYVPATYSVDCAAGEVAIGGGFKPRRLVWMLGSFPESSSSWAVAVASELTRPTRATIYAVCMSAGGETAPPPA